MSATLCKVGTPCEVLVKVQCRPEAAMLGTLYIKQGENRRERHAPRNEEWCTIVPHGDAVAGADFRGMPFADISIVFHAMPPVYPVVLQVQTWP